MSSFLPRVQLSMLGAASSSSTFAPLWVKVRFVRFCLIFLTNWGCETSRVTGYCCGSRSGKMFEAAPKRYPACSKSYFGSSQHFWNHRNVANSTIWQWLWLSEFKILWCAKFEMSWNFECTFVLLMIDILTELLLEKWQVFWVLLIKRSWRGTC